MNGSDSVALILIQDLLLTESNLKSYSQCPTKIFAACRRSFISVHEWTTGQTSYKGMLWEILIEDSGTCIGLDAFANLVQEMKKRTD